MKCSLAKLGPQFNMHRMVMQYANEYYLVAHERHRNLHAEDAARAKGLAAWRKRVEEAWPRVRVKTLPTSVSEVNLGSDVEVNVKVALDTLSPEDVSVQIADRQSGRTGPIAGAGHHGHGMQRA